MQTAIQHFADKTKRKLSPTGLPKKVFPKNPVQFLTAEGSLETIGFKRRSFGTFLSLVKEKYEEVVVSL